MPDVEKVINKVTAIVADMQEEVDEWKDYSDSELRGGFTCDCDWWYKTLQTLKDAIALLKALDVMPEELERLKKCRHECKIDCLLEHYDKIKAERDALLKAQEPLLVTHIHEEYPEHLWTKDENGNVNEWAMEFDYHQGPVCERCGDTFCIHCEPDGYITHKKCVVDVYKCPKCGSELRSNQKHCDKCGQAVKWE